MKRTSFNADWTVGPKQNTFGDWGTDKKQNKSITLPHDAMWENERRTDGDSSIACYPGGEYEYKKTFYVPPISVTNGSQSSLKVYTIKRWYTSMAILPASIRMVTAIFM